MVMAMDMAAPGGANESSSSNTAASTTPGAAMANEMPSTPAPSVALSCNEWLNRGTAGGAAEASSSAGLSTEGHGRGRHRQRRGALRGDSVLRACATPGCDRCYRNGKHSHCCGRCSIGLHTERCDRAWIKVQMQPLRARISMCVTTGCRRAAGLTHLHCCTLCVWHKGADHTDACHERQTMVWVRGMEVNPVSAHESGAGSSMAGSAPSSAEKPGDAMAGPGDKKTKMPASFASTESLTSSNRSNAAQLGPCNPQSVPIEISSEESDDDLTLSPDVSGATAATGCEPSEYAEPLVLDAMD